MPRTQTQLVAHLVEQTELSKNDVKSVLTALGDTILGRDLQRGEVQVRGARAAGGQAQRRHQGAPGRNPATGETITIGPKPASVQLKARPLAKAKSALPSVQKAKKKLA